MNSADDTRRILDMVERGKITAAEGARLLETAAPKPRTKNGPAPAVGTTTCPYCAESIPAGPGPCPECGTPLGVPPIRTAAGSRFQSLTGLGKFLAIYTLLAAGISLLSLFPGFGVMSGAEALLSVLGLVAGIRIIQRKTAGWGLGILWSILQIVTVIIHGQIINRQLFHFGFNYYVNGQGLGINLVGIILLILFIKAKQADN